MPEESSPPASSRNSATSTSNAFSRRSLLMGAGAAAVGLGIYDQFVSPTWVGNTARNLLGGSVDTNPEGPIPDVPPATTSYRVRPSQTRGQDVGWYTAIPRDQSSGAGLPVVIILHGASATAAKFEGFGFGQFLTAAIERGTEPFVLVGADGGRTGWRGKGPGSADDPQAMVGEEIPQWCEELGFDTSRIALWGWSMGGAGALNYTANPVGFTPRATAAFSPAIGRLGDEQVDALTGTPLALWCGEQDSLIRPAKALTQQLTELGNPPEIAHWAPGSHTRRLWNTFTLDAFDFLSRNLSTSA